MYNSRKYRATLNQPVYRRESMGLLGVFCWAVVIVAVVGGVIATGLALAGLIF